MWDEFDPIDPGEPLVPKHEPIEITPGRPPDSKPLELKPSAPRKFEDDAPEIKEPELMSEGSDGIKPPTGNKWSDWQKRDGKFPFVDENLLYMTFRNQNFKYSDELIEELLVLATASQPSEIEFANFHPKLGALNLVQPFD